MVEINKDEQVLLHIVKYCNQIETVMKAYKLTKNKFEDNFVIQNALSMSVLQIGELAKKLSPEFRSSNNEIPWRSIAGIRDKLAHDYIEMDVDVVWEVVSKDIAVLNNYCKKYLLGKGIPLPKPEKIVKANLGR